MWASDACYATSRWIFRQPCHDFDRPWSGTSKACRTPRIILSTISNSKRFQYLSGIERGRGFQRHFAVRKLPAAAERFQPARPPRFWNRSDLMRFRLAVNS
jgi:hypothetical protein